MPPRRHSPWVLGAALLASGVLLLLLHYLVFAQLHDTLYYVFMDVAFIPIQLLIAGLILERWLRARERRVLLSKLNTVIGTFFAEVGTPLLRDVLAMDAGRAAVAAELQVAASWTAQDFSAAHAFLRHASFHVPATPAAWRGLRDLLHGKREFLLRLLENPNLLEHEMFTELLLAVFHLAEELEARGDLSQLPAADCQHVAVDIGRAYGGLTREWLAHLEYLKRDYPFLFSFAVRTNPFNPQATVTVQ